MERVREGGEMKKIYLGNIVIMLAACCMMGCSLAGNAQDFQKKEQAYLNAATEEAAGQAVAGQIEDKEAAVQEEETQEEIEAKVEEAAQEEVSEEEAVPVIKIREIDTIEDFSLVFDATYYSDRYPDLKAVFGNDEAALLKHFKENGMEEARVAHPEFDVKAYMMNNLDLVAEMKADDLTEYFAHYIKSGKTDGRVSVYQPGQQPAEGVLATFTTYYDPKEMRAINVELASARMNGTILEPGNSFSFSNCVGTRTVQNGYVDGPSIAGGKEVTSIGGGICQVSSNLYVSLLLAGIEPIEHHYHGLPVDYVPKKLDAAIAENYLDLRFENTRTENIIIESVAMDGVLTVTLRKG